MKDQSKFTIEKRLLRSGERYIVRESRYSNSSAPHHVIDHSAHSSLDDALSAFQHLEELCANASLSAVPNVQLAAR